MVNRSNEPYRRDADQEALISNEQQDIVTADGSIVGQNVGTTAMVDHAEARRSTADWLTGLLSLIIGVIAILIAIRIVLKLLAANTASGFTNFIYGVTGPLVAPFQNIFGATATGEGANFEISSVLAIAIYLLIGWLITRLLVLIIDRPTSGVSVTRNVDKRTLR